MICCAYTPLTNCFSPPKKLTFLSSQAIAPTSHEWSFLNAKRCCKHLFLLSCHISLSRWRRPMTFCSSLLCSPTVYKSTTFQTSSITQLARHEMEPAVWSHWPLTTSYDATWGGGKKNISASQTTFITTDSSITTKWNQPSGPLITFTVSNSRTDVAWWGALSLLTVRHNAWWVHAVK